MASEPIRKSSQDGDTPDVAAPRIAPGLRTAPGSRRRAKAARKTTAGLLP